MTGGYWDPLYPWSDLVRIAGLLLLLAGTLALLGAALVLLLRRQRIPGLAVGLAALGTSTTAVVIPVVWPFVEGWVLSSMYFYPPIVQSAPIAALMVPIPFALLWGVLGGSDLLLAFGLLFVSRRDWDGVGTEGEAR